jgi:hypothetical protein
VSAADRDPFDLLGRWLAEPAQVAAIRGQVTVRQRQGADGHQTTVAIDHQLVCPVEPFGTWRITTKPTMLPRAHFSSEATHLLRAADPKRGRTVYCHDRNSGQVVAAVAYHIDARRQMPVLVTAIAFRDDVADNPQLGLQSLAGALLLKHYVHAIADLAGREGYLDLDLANRDREPDARRLGFRPAPRVRGFRPGGTHLRQLAPADQPSGIGP